MTPSILFAKSLPLLVLISLAGCGGGGSGSHQLPTVLPPGAPSPAPAVKASVQLKLVIPPPPSSASNRGRRPVYVSPASNSLTFAQAGGPSTTAAITQNSPNCTTDANGLRTCTATVSANSGQNQSFSIKTFASMDGSGATLSAATIVQTIVPGQINTVSATLNGVVASLSVALNPSNTSSGMKATVAVIVNALDASGNTIVGPGTYADANGALLTLTLADSDNSGATHLSTTSLSAPTTGITLSYDGTSIPNPTVSAAAPGIASALKTLTIGCPGPGSSTDLYIAVGASVRTYSLSASGNATPLSSLSVPSAAVAVDPQGAIYLAQPGATGVDKNIEVFCSLANGNATPQRTIVTPSGTFPASLAFDASGNLYAVDSRFLNSELDEYAPGAGAAGTPSSNATPTPTTRAIFGLGDLGGQVGIDTSGSAYVSDSRLINVYGPSANGNAAPARQIASLVAGLLRPLGNALAVDPAGDAFVMYASDYRAGRGENSGYSVGIYPSGSVGPPAHVLTFDSNTHLGQGGAALLQGVAADASGTLYVLSGHLQIGGNTTATAIAIYPPGDQDGDATPLRVITDNGSVFGTAVAIAVDGSGNIYVTNSAGHNSNVVVYAPGATTPTRTFGNGSLTDPRGSITVAADGTAYVSEFQSGVVSVYAAGASGTQAPLRTLNVAANFPGVTVDSLAVDPSGTLYMQIESLVNGFDDNNLPMVVAYAAGASGAQAPTRTFTDPFLRQDTFYGGGIASDATGHLYVTGQLSNTISIYPTSSTGSTSASRFLSFVAPSTRARDNLSFLNRTFVDANANLYVASTLTNSILVYAPGTSAPTRSIIGPHTHLFVPMDMAVDPSGNLYVASGSFAYSVTLVFGPTANGDATPLRILNARGPMAIGPGP